MGTSVLLAPHRPSLSQEKESTQDTLQPCTKTEIECPLVSWFELLSQYTVCYDRVGLFTPTLVLGCPPLQNFCQKTFWAEGRGSTNQQKNPPNDKFDQMKLIYQNRKHLSRNFLKKLLGCWLLLGSPHLKNNVI